VEAIEDLEGVAIDETAGDGMLRPGNDTRLDELHLTHDQGLYPSPKRPRSS